MNLALAVKFGTNESLFLTNLCFWIEKNKANRVNYHDGHYWVYNTMDAWAELFPYFSKDQIRRLINKMRERNILLVGVYNRIHYDRTQWYSVNDEVMALYLGGYKKEEPGDDKQQKDKKDRQEYPETPEEKTEKEANEPVDEEPAICPEGPMDVAEVPHPSASGGAWMWRNRHMEAANSPDRSGGIATTIPYNKPINKPVAAAAEKIPKGQMPQPVENSGKAAAGFFDIEKLKTALLRINRELVFDDSFYPKAVEIIKAQGFDDDYLSWLYAECRKRKPDNLRGLYFSLFAKEDMAALYRDVEKERHKAKAPAPQRTCPACETTHPAYLEICPECGLEKEDRDNPAKIERQRKFHRLPKETKDEYAKEQWTIFSRALKSRMPFEKTKAQWIVLDKKYHLLE
jgi:hypothetical protein